METKNKKKEPEKQAEIPLEEQMMRRQSAPRPTAQDEAQKLFQMQGGSGIAYGKQPDNGALDGFRALAQVIGKEQVQKARQTLQKY